MWKSDGTEQGTVLVKDVTPGPDSSGATPLIGVNGVLFFRTSNPLGLWRTDGTEAGTALIREGIFPLGPSYPNRCGGGLAAVNNLLVFVVQRGACELWRSDGVTADFLIELPGAGNALRMVSGLVLFSVYDSAHGRELWATDGTSVGMVQDIAPGPAWSSPSSFTPVGPLVFFQANDHVLIVDWVEGSSLAKVLADQGDPGLTPMLAVSYLAQLAQALDHLHAHGRPIVHGNVKPDNAVLTPEGQVVLVDFGLVDAGGGATASGYVAPEVAAGEPPTPAADVYGLAATAIALLTGSPPRGEVSWEGVDPVLAGALDRAVRRGLATDPARRPRRAGELVQRLRGALASALPTGVGTFCLTETAKGRGWFFTPLTEPLATNHSDRDAQLASDEEVLVDPHVHDRRELLRHDGHTLAVRSVGICVSQRLAPDEDAAMVGLQLT